MNVVVINGSPRGEKSNSYQLTKAFMEGLNPADITVFHLAKMHIDPCKGCFACWKHTPGKCVIKDDVAEVLERIVEAEIIIWSFPLYYFSVPGLLKNLIDRQLPLILPEMEKNEDGNESGGHPSRYDKAGQRYVLISTCGFYRAAGNYDAVISMFDHFQGNGNHTDIFCGQGELFSVPELRARTEQYLNVVRQAGKEFAAGAISKQTTDQLQQLLYPRDVFEKMADASWGVQTGDSVKTDDSAFFTRQMAALYNKKSYQDKEKVLEIYYTDLDRRYQLWMGKEGCKVVEADFKEATTIIETPYTVWRDISKGKISGSAALMEQKYRVIGDFNIMMNWDYYFNGGIELSKAIVKEDKQQKRTNMNLLLIPWIAVWILISIDNLICGAAGVIISALIPFAWLKYHSTIFEKITIFAVSVFSLLLLLNIDPAVILPGSYLAFGLMWFITGFLAMPLTAHYSKDYYGGERMLDNPIFVRTNRILTVCWGVLYFIIAGFSFVMMDLGNSWLTLAVNSGAPIMMGVFTKWFQKWYPVRVAAGK